MLMIMTYLYYRDDLLYSVFKGTWSTSTQCGRVLDFSYMENEVTSNIHSQSVSIHRLKVESYSISIHIIKRDDKE